MHFKIVIYDVTDGSRDMFLKIFFDEITQNARVHNCDKFYCDIMLQS